MTKEQEFLEEYTSLIENGEYEKLSNLIDSEIINLVNTSEIKSKEEYLAFLKSKINKASIKIERVSHYKIDDIFKGLIIYTINGSTNYKVVSIVSFLDGLIKKIDDYWFVIF